MKKVQAKTVGDIITDLLKKEHLDGKIDEQRILAQWPEVVGTVINRYTVSRYIKDRVMYVHLSSASLRNELMMHRTRLIASLNGIVNKEIIKDIVLK